ncbi:hypothetical protein [Bacillus pseudomycoides]|uniref:hypothetical protein n=1 Tax=Bacillus pseudomycoides TaxID=64104 RepID=UPI002FFD8B05
MVINLNEKYVNLINYSQQYSGIHLNKFNILNIVFVSSAQTLVNLNKIEELPELTRQYQQIENQITNEERVNIA